MKHLRGFSLIESLFVLLVFGVALGLTANLLKRYLRVGRYVEQRQQWQSLRAAAQRMCEEVYESQTVELTGNVLELTKFSPSSHKTRRDPGVFTVGPYDESYLVNIRYELVTQDLVRSVGDASIPVASPLEHLDMILEDGLLTVNVGFKSQTALQQQTFLVEVLR
jgi:prepilin-type N-terminal cleavage/methylation domain-containing protein